jgi:hypothetical protein
MTGWYRVAWRATDGQRQAVVMRFDQRPVVGEKLVIHGKQLVVRAVDDTELTQAEGADRLVDVEAEPTD